jgi:hypothetical protein
MEHQKVVRVTYRPCLFAIASLAAGLLAGCSSSAGINGPGSPVTLCGTAMWQGEAYILPTLTGPPRAGSHPPAPSGSELPPLVHGGFSGLPLLVQVSPGCSRGRIVRVLGAAGVETLAVAHSADGLIAGFTLLYTGPGSPIDVLAYSGRRLVGELVVDRG